MECFSEITAANKIRESLQKFAHMNCGTMEVKEALGKDRDRDDATAQNWPHQQSALLDVFNHAGFVALFSDCGKPTTKGRSSASTQAHSQRFVPGYLQPNHPTVDFFHAVLVKKRGECWRPSCGPAICPMHRKWNSRFVCRMHRSCKRSCAARCRLLRFGFLPEAGPRRRTCTGS